MNELGTKAVPNARPWLNLMRKRVSLTPQSLRRGSRNVRLLAPVDGGVRLPVLDWCADTDEEKEAVAMIFASFSTNATDVGPESTLRNLTADKQRLTLLCRGGEV